MQIFKTTFINTSILGKKSFQIVVPCTLIILPDHNKAVVDKNNSKTLVFKQLCEGNPLQKLWRAVYQSNCDHDLYAFTQNNTVLMHMVNRNFCGILSRVCDKIAVEDRAPFSSFTDLY